jgi:predicted Holliday junction resolvase-like endonuclease
MPDKLQQQLRIEQEEKRRLELEHPHNSDNPLAGDDPDKGIIVQTKTAKLTLELKRVLLEIKKVAAETDGWTFESIAETKAKIEQDKELLQKKESELNIREQTLSTTQKSISTSADDLLIEFSPTTSMRQIEVPEQLYDILMSAWKQTDHEHLWGFIEELFHDWDKSSALSRQERELAKLSKEREEDSKIHQRASLKGAKIEMWFPYLSEFPYSNGDVIPVRDSVDFITLNGRTNQHITDILFQDVQTGENSHYIKSDSNKGLLRDFIESLDNPHIKFELYARKDTDDIFHLVNR